MKAAKVSYERASSLNEALRLLDGDGFVRVLAGGQSLLPMLNMRLMRPDLLVDIAEVAELRALEPSEGGVSVGSLVTYKTIEHSPLVGDRAPLLAQAIGLVGDLQIRNRGTAGGSVAHGDPTAELPLACLVLGCEVEIASVNGTRLIPLSHFLVGSYETALEPNEMVVRLQVRRQSGVGAFLEATRRHNDFAIVSVAAVGSLDEDEMFSSITVGFGGVADTVVLAPSTAAALIGVRLDEDVIEAAVEVCRQEIDPASDIRGSVEYRRHLAGEYLRRAISRLTAAGRLAA